LDVGHPPADYPLACFGLALMSAASIYARDNQLGASAAPPESLVSAVSWRSILAGAAAAAASSLILLALGAGLGLAAISPWARTGVSATSFSVGAGVWLLITQWLSSGVGGFVTGRLRTKWVRVHTHEIFFRDTAHGFLTWATASLLVAYVVASAVGTGTQAAATAGSGDPPGTSAAMAYDVDTLFRGQKPEALSPQAHAEAARILATGAHGDVSAADRAYLAQLITARAGVPPAEATKRVDDTITHEKVVADAARKAASMAGFFTAISMLVGAFIASVAAAYGGRVRDEHPVWREGDVY
jgi:hypothetical protein